LHSARLLKAFILAAGLGRRWRSLGLNIPKVMTPIAGWPSVQYHFEFFLQKKGSGSLS